MSWSHGPSATAQARLMGLDALRGIAILMMVAFHFCFDLTYWRLAHFQLLSDWRWIAWRDLIVSLFLLLVGMSLVLARGQSAARFWRRWARLTGCALLISLVSWGMFSQRFIYFGVLHFISLTWLLSRLWLSRAAWLRHRVLLPLALLCLLAGGLLAFPAMDPRWLNWLGLAAHKPATEDYVPLLPWLGLVLLGMSLAQTSLAAWLGRRGGGGWRPLAWLGRHSLAIYLLHQPLLMGLLALYVWYRASA